MGDEGNPADDPGGSGDLEDRLTPSDLSWLTRPALTPDQEDEALRRAQGILYLAPRFVPPPVDIVRLRRRLNMTQVQFARRLGLSVHTLRHWEYGDRKPRRSAQILLALVERDVATAMRLLRRRSPQCFP